MNRQPYQTPPRRWESQLSPWWVRLWRPLRRRALRREQKLARIDVADLDQLRQPLAEGAAVLITPNHAFHYDSYALMEAGDQLDRPFHFLTAWQAFAMSNRFERWSMQRHGCFSIDREGNDMPAFRRAVALLQESPYPLVIFSEGDIYHTNDRVTPFREGAAAIALAAARRADRPVVCVPCALKCWYVSDPTPELSRVLSRLEERLTWLPRPDLPLVERVYRLGEGLLALKELEHLGGPRTGTVPARTAGLIREVLGRQERQYGVDSAPDAVVPERVKELRRRCILALEKPGADAARVRRDLEELFLVTQLFSYPGDYVRENPTVERVAETIDKLEEDVLQAPYPGVRGVRRVLIRFGAAVPIPTERQKRDAVRQLSENLSGRVQGLLDDMNRTVSRSRVD